MISCALFRIKMDKESMSINAPDVTSQRMFAQFAVGNWYAIPASMAESFRKAGAKIAFADEIATLDKRHQGDSAGGIAE